MLACAIMLFSFLNWNSVEITLWDGFLVETKVPALVILAFLLGLFPMWLYHRSVKWGLSRRIRSLENSIKSSALAKQSTAAASTEAPARIEAPASDTLKPVADTPSESS